jgi:ATP-dependent Clp protease ATP-binding subunit ClpA
VYRTDSSGERVAQVGVDDKFEEVSSKIKSEIEKHFKLALGRPEILNRIGENIIVFDFVRNDTAIKIFEHQLKGTIEDLASTQNISLDISADAKSQLQELVITDLSSGGRGIRNRLEAHFINPLSRAIFDQGIQGGDSCAVTSVTAGSVTNISLSKSEQVRAAV